MEITITKYSSRLINIVKKDNVSNDAVSIIGFLLLLKKRGVLSAVKSFSSNRSNSVLEFISSLLVNESENIIDIWNCFAHDFHILQSSSLSELIYMLDEDIVDDYLAAIFDEVIRQSAKESPVEIGKNFQPKEISELICKLTDSTTPMVVYNPFAGMASYGVLFGKKHHYIGQEIDRYVWAIGKIRLILNDAHVYDYELADSISNWNSLGRKYDLLVSTPPFGYWQNPYSYSRENVLPAHSYEEFFILNGINNSLKDGGKLIGIFSEGLLFGNNNSQRTLRKELVENGYVEMIISLPSNIFYNTSITTSIVLLSKKDFNDEKSVKFIDGSSFFKNIGGKNILQSDALFSIIESSDENRVRTISTEQIKRNNYKLHVRSYFINKIEIKEGYRAIKLKEILKYSNKREKVTDVNRKILSISDLTNDRFDYEKKYTQKSNKARERAIYAYYSDEDILLVSLRFKNIKPTYYSYNDSRIYYSSNVSGFHLLSDKIDIGYLIHELNADYVKQQVEYFSIGSVMPYIRVNDFLNIEIQIPSSIEEQRATVKGAKEAAQIASVKELGLEEIIEKMKANYVDEMRIKKHNLAQYINSLQSSVSALIKFIKKNDGTISEKQLISIQRHITVEQHLQNMMNTAKEIGMYVNSLTKDLVFGDTKIIDLNGFISRFINNYPQDKFVFKYNRDKESFFENNKQFDPITAISESDLKEVFNNIIENAENHGFVDATKKHYVILISLSYDSNKKMLRIDIANNGKPMPSGMDESRYTLKYEKAGITGKEGLGGYRIYQIITHFGGNLKLNLNEQDEFPVTITLYFPLITIES